MNNEERKIAGVRKRSVGRWLAPAANKYRIAVETGLAPVRNKLHTNHISGQPQGLSLWYDINYNLGTNTGSLVKGAVIF